MALQAVPVPVVASQPNSRFEPAGHHLLLTEDGAGNGLALYRQLKLQGAKVSLLRFTELPAQENIGAEDVAEDVLEVSLQELNDKALAKLLDDIVSARGPLTGFLHLNPVFSTVRGPVDCLDPLESSLIRVVFFLAKHLKRPLAKQRLQRQFFTVVTRMDGKLGFSGNAPASVIQGGYCGLIKSMKMEAPSLFCRCIDIAPSIDSSELLSILQQELADPSIELLEVGRPSIGERFSVQKYQADIPAIAHLQQPTENSVFLVSGGGRGVTARCIERLAEHYHCKFIIIGRTPIGQAEPEWAQACADETALRKALLAQAKANGEKAIPVHIDRSVKKLVTQRELLQTISTIRALGGEAIYISEDILHADTVKTKVQAAVSALGPITGIIHGAGNIADKLLEVKEEADFDLVYGSKVTSLRTLLECVELSQLQFLVLFSSISGFYGQFGQSDYSLSNEILNKFVQQIGHSYSIPVLRSINWGPWDGGMVSPALKKVYEKFHVHVMPIDEGVEFFLDEFLFQEPGAEQVLVCPKNIDEVRSTLSTNEAMARL